MTGSSSIPSFKGSIGDEGVGALEQEAFVRGSSDFRPNLTATGLESTLNHVVGFFTYYVFVCFILVGFSRIIILAGECHVCPHHACRNDFFFNFSNNYCNHKTTITNIDMHLCVCVKELKGCVI